MSDPISFEEKVKKTAAALESFWQKTFHARPQDGDGHATQRLIAAGVTPKECFRILSEWHALESQDQESFSQILTDLPDSAWSEKIKQKFLPKGIPLVIQKALFDDAQHALNSADLTQAERGHTFQTLHDWISTFFDYSIHHQNIMMPLHYSGDGQSISWPQILTAIYQHPDFDPTEEIKTDKYYNMYHITRQIQRSIYTRTIGLATDGMNDAEIRDAYFTYRNIPTPDGHQEREHFIRMRVDGSYILKKEDGEENRLIALNDTFYQQGRTTQKLTDRYIDIGRLLPVFERARQMMGLFYGLVQLRESGFKPSAAFQKVAGEMLHHFERQAPLPSQELICLSVPLPVIE